MKINKYSLALLVQLSFVLFLYQIARVLFYLFNYSYFSALTWTELGNILYGSFQFDLSAVLYLNLVLIVLYLLPLPLRDFLYRKKVFLYLFVVFNAIGIGANIIDIGYFPFTLKRTTAEIFQEFVGLENLFSLFTQFFVDYYYLIIIWAIFTYILYYFAKKIQITDSFFYKNHTRAQKTIYFSQEIVWFILCIGFTLLGMRGHLNVHRSPTTLADAGNYIQDPVGIALVLNTPFSIILTVQSTSLKSIVYFKDIYCYPFQ